MGAFLDRIDFNQKRTNALSFNQFRSVLNQKQVHLLPTDVLVDTANSFMKYICDQIADNVSKSKTRTTEKYLQIAAIEIQERIYQSDNARRCSCCIRN